MKKVEIQNHTTAGSSKQIQLFSESLNKKNFIMFKMKIWHHFYSKKDCSYTRICKQNFYLMHGNQEMNFFSFGTLRGSNVFWKKVKVNNKILQNWVHLMFLLGLRNTVHQKKILLTNSCIRAVFFRMKVVSDFYFGQFLTLLI